MWPSSGVRDTVCYLYELTLSRFQPFITQNLLGQFLTKSSHRCLTISLPCISNLKKIGPAVPEICGYKCRPNFFTIFFLQHSLICLKTTSPYLECYQICTVNNAIYAHFALNLFRFQ